MGIRCKFVCSEVARTQAGGVNDDGTPATAERVKLHAVYDSKESNKAWSRWTPSGNFEVLITNPAAHGQFEPGKEYYLDVVPAE